MQLSIIKTECAFTLASLRNAAHVFMLPVCTYEHRHAHAPLLSPVASHSSCPTLAVFDR